jgi:hypothetical protein
LNRVFVLETLEELGPVNAVQHASTPVQRFNQAERFQFALGGDLFIEGADERHVQGPLPK